MEVSLHLGSLDTTLAQVLLQKQTANMKELETP